MFLCVDLDKTLIKTDSLHESLIRLFVQNPFYFLKSIIELRKGKSAFKNYLASKINLSTKNFPVNEKVIGYIKKRKYENNETIILVTGAHQSIAEDFGRNFPLFDEVYGSTKNHNLVGQRKAQFLKDKFGKFDYIGDSVSDLFVWEKAHKAIYSGKKTKLWDKLQKKHKNCEIIEAEYQNSFKVFLKSIRVHQWAKNILVFFPLFFAHQYTDTSLVLKALIAFFAFCMTSSSVYLLNDLFDLDADRVHRTKQNRPIPSGKISFPLVICIITLFLSAAIYLSSKLTGYFALILGAYFLISFAYSFRLKRIIVLDISLLSLLFTIRILSGHIALNINISPWLLTFSIFIFFSLATLKRVVELRSKLPSNESVEGRGYQVEDLQLLSQMGVTSGMITPLIILLYLNGHDVQKLYSKPHFLWGICPLLIYWIGRMWIFGHRGKIDDDPIIFVLKDKVSIFIGILCVLQILLSI